MGYFRDKCTEVRLPIAESGSPGLRPAQIAATHALSAHFFGQQEPAIVVMPTGSGKTCVMLLASFLLRATRVLVISPSRMVRDQIAAGFETLGVLRACGAIASGFEGPKVGILKGQPGTPAEWEDLRQFDVVVSTVQSASPGMPGVALPPADLFDLVCCDEAHHTPAPTWNALVDNFSSARHAFFTATPFRRDNKPLRGKLVFDYPLARARKDGVFGTIKYQPVVLGPADSADVMLAKETEKKFLEDRAAGRPHLVMVRTARRARADELENVYANNTALRLRKVLGKHGTAYLKKAVHDLEAGTLDGLICVDMLGEGFDLPTLKIAALHSPHRSLAVTLQFIGRFARTNAADTGDATFLAIPSEIETEAERLYVVGAEWNELVEEASRKKITAERENRELLESFKRVGAAPRQETDAAEEELDLSSLAPYFHVKVIEAVDGVDLEATLPVQGERLLLKRSEDGSALVCVTRKVLQCRWSRDERLSDVSHALFILFYDENSHLLFVCSSRRETAVYDALVEAVALGETRRLSPDEVNRVLRDLKNATFFSVGMRNRSGFGNAESYRMISGKYADRAIQKSDGRFYDRGHCFGRGESGGGMVTIGFSSASKVWANQYGNLRTLFEWCRALGAKLKSDSAVSTHSGLDNLPLGRRAHTFPEHLVAGDWADECYKRDNLRIRFKQDPNDGYPLLDYGVRVLSGSEKEAVFAVEGHGRSVEFSYRLDRSKWFEACGTDVPVVVEGEYREPVPLTDYLHEHPPSFFSANLARIQGDALSDVPASDDEFSRDAIERIQWSAAGVDPCLEKPNGTSGSARSLFEWLQARLEQSDARVIFNDDDAGEIADFVTIRSVQAGHADVVFYHCKAAGDLPVPGERVGDLYEVTGQAVKSLRLTDKAGLRQHIVRRTISTKAGKARFVKGTEQDVEELLRDGVVGSFEIVIVQPGVGGKPPKKISSLLAAANAYIVGAQIKPLRVIGSDG
jgi:superfamily II DNA or RNA helicase